MRKLFKWGNISSGKNIQGNKVFTMILKIVTQYFNLKIDQDSGPLMPCHLTMWTLTSEFWLPLEIGNFEEIMGSVSHLFSCIGVVFDRSKNLATPSYLQGGFQLVDLVITELKSHMTCYNASPLIGWNYSIQTGEQIL